MSDGAHLLIPLASCDREGCIEARRTLELPALQKLLARMILARSDAGGEHDLSMPHERAIAREFGLPVDDGRIPWAAWQAAQSNRGAPNEPWAWITPCHWQVNRDHIAMRHPQDLEIDAHESQALLAAMRPYFEQDGIALDYEAPTLWLARGEVFRSLATASLDRVIGRVVDDWLPRAPEARPLRKLQQEMQMLLYTNETNEMRARGGLLPVNSFWISGTGVLPADTRLAPPPGLFITHYLRDAAIAGDWRGWTSAWRQIDSRECTRLLQSLDRGEPVTLTLCGERHAQTWTSEGASWLRRLKASFRPVRTESVLAAL